MEILRQNKLVALIVMVLVGHLFWFKFEFHKGIVFIDLFERLILISLACYVYKFRKTDFLGWSKLITKRNLLSSIFATVTLLISAPFIEIAVIEIDASGIWYHHYFPIISDRVMKLLVLFGTLVLVALHEELVYRKLVLDVLLQFKLGSLPIYLISASLFSLLHVNQSATSAISAFWAGIVLMYVYRKCQTLWVPILSHYMVNFYLISYGVPFVREVPY